MDLADFLMGRGRIDEVQRERIRALRRERGESESVIITRLGMVDEREMAATLAEFLAIPLAREADYPTEPLCAGELSADFIGRARILPLKEMSDGLALAMADPSDLYTIKAVRLAAGRSVVPWAAVPSELAEAQERLYGIGGGKLERASSGPAVAAREDLRRLNDFATDEPVIRY